MIFFLSAERTLEAGDTFCWVGAFSLTKARASHPHTSLWATRGPLRRGEKNHPPSARGAAFGPVFFPPRPLTPKDNRPAPPRLAKDVFDKKEKWSRGKRWIHGAGEGIRTLDFNLGKVALYP